MMPEELSVTLNDVEIKLIKYLYKDPSAKPSSLIPDVKKRTLYNNVDSLLEKDLLKITLDGKNKVYKLTDAGNIIGWVYCEPKRALQYFNEFLDDMPKERRRIPDDKIVNSIKEVVIDFYGSLMVNYSDIVTQLKSHLAAEKLTEEELAISAHVRMLDTMLGIKPVKEKYMRLVDAVKEAEDAEILFAFDNANIDLIEAEKKTGHSTRQLDFTNWFNDVTSSSREDKQVAFTVRQLLLRMVCELAINKKLTDYRTFLGELGEIAKLDYKRESKDGANR